MKRERPQATVISPERPICSRCCVAVDRAVEFLAVNVRDGRPLHRRGSSRKVRLCRACVGDLAQSIGKRGAR